MSGGLEAGSTGTQWAAELSHEVRTPLAAVVAATRALCGEWTTLSPEQRRALVAVVAQQGEQLAALVAGEIGVAEPPGAAPVACELASLVYSTVAAERVAHPRATIRVAVPDSVPPIRGDSVKLRQVLSNLIDNALTHGGLTGPVEVRVTTEAERVGVAVADRGPGIASAEQSAIFERGRQASATEARGGAGLGLWIARSIAAAHGGELTLRSVSGEGAVFTLWLPRADAPGIGALT